MFVVGCVYWGLFDFNVYVVLFQYLIIREMNNDIF
jgi:hypothetical protein